LGYISLIVGDSQGILSQQLRPHPIHLLYVIIILISYIIKFKKVLIIPTKVRNGTQNRLLGSSQQVYQTNNN
jgi:hypothetical protein